MIKIRVEDEKFLNKDKVQQDLKVTNTKRNKGNYIGTRLHRKRIKKERKGTE